MLHVQVFVADQSQNSTWGSNNNVRAVGLQDLLILLNGHATEEHSDLHIISVLAESLILFADLESQFTSMTQHDHRDLKQRKLHNNIKSSLSEECLHSTFEACW